MSSQFATIDDYIKSRPTAVQDTLEQVRQTIRRAAPGASERISYHMPAMRLNGRAFPLAAPIPYGLIEHVLTLRAPQLGDNS